LKIKLGTIPKAKELYVWRDLLNVLAAVTERGAGFRSLKDAWADTTTPH
jgi:hypothetical protein